MEQKEENGMRERQMDRTVVQDDIYMMGRKGGLRVEVREEDSGVRYLKIRKWWDAGGRVINSGIRINREDHWRQICRLVDGSLARYLGWSEFEIEPLQGEDFISVKKHKQALMRKEKVIEQRTREMRDMQNDVLRMRRNLKTTLESQMKTKLPQHKATLKAFERLLATSEKERELHTFLKENHWIFGPQYVSARSEQQIGFKLRGDFLLERLDGFYNIVELKKADAKIFSRSRLSAISKNAISQMIQYLHKCDTLYTQHYTELKMDILKPEGRIVIGRSDAEVDKNLRIHNAYLNRMKILTYDQLLSTAKRMLKSLEKSS